MVELCKIEDVHTNHKYHLKTKMHNIANKYVYLCLNFQYYSLTDLRGNFLICTSAINYICFLENSHCVTFKNLSFLLYVGQKVLKSNTL